MIKIYIDNEPLDLYPEESIELNRSIKNLLDISTVYADFTQTFTVPASPTNNRILQHYYRDDLQNSISSLKRLDATITLNGQVFQKGGIQIEGATIENGVPRNYKLGFFGNVSRLKEFTGEDTLKDLDFTTYDHSYESSNVLDGFGSNSVGGGIGLSSGAIIYPPFSPVRNWTYNSTDGNQVNNIAYIDDAIVNGINWFELKPAIQVTKILDQIESRYGVTFSGSFLSSTPFTQLYMWLHTFEGYTFEGKDNLQSQGVIVEKLINFSETSNTTALTQQGTELRFTSGTYNGTRSYQFTLEFNTINNPCYLYYYENGVLQGTILASATGTPYVFNSSPIGSGTNTILEIKVGRTTSNLTIDADLDIAETAGVLALPTSSGSAVYAQTSTSYSEQVVISNLMPDMKVTDFLNGLVKMYNLVVTSDDGKTFTFQTYDSFLSSGQEVDLSRYLDGREVNVEEIPRYGALEFKYNESDQVLQKQFRETNGRGYGDLVQRFNFDSSETFSVEAPFDLPFTELLLDDSTGTSFTDFTVYKSIEVNENGEGSSYYGAPCLFYYSDNLDISSTPIEFVDDSGVANEIVLITYSETINNTSTTANSLTYSEEQNPYLNDVPDDNLYSDYWSSFIRNTYNQQAKMFRLSAELNLGVFMDLNLNDLVLWKGRKYIINNMRTDLRTGKTELELITKL